MGMTPLRCLLQSSSILSSRAGSPSAARPATSSRRISGVILSCGFARSRSISLALCSDDRSPLYLHTRRNAMVNTRPGTRSRRAMPLAKHEQGLVPEHGKGPGVVAKLYKMRHQCVQDPEGQCVFLVEQDSDKDAVRARVVHLG